MSDARTATDGERGSVAGGACVTKTTTLSSGVVRGGPAPKVCGDCGGPRHGYSGDKCRPCWRASMVQARREAREAEWLQALLLDDDSFARLLAAADRRGTNPRTLVMELIERVVDDDLIDAVMDDG